MTTPAEFSITDSEIQLLCSYIKEANSFSSIFESYEKPKVSYMF